MQSQTQGRSLQQLPEQRKDYVHTPLRSRSPLFKLPRSDIQVLHDFSLFINREDIRVMKKTCGNDVTLFCPSGYMIDGPKTTTVRYQHQTSRCMPSKKSQ